MSSVPFALAEAAVAQATRPGHLSKTPPKRRSVAVPDRKLNPEPR